MAGRMAVRSPGCPTSASRAPRIERNLMGTIARSWELLKESFSILKSDKELMWLPVLSSIFCLMATITIFGIGFLLLVPPGPLPQDPAGQKMLEQQMLPVVFV